ERQLAVAVASVGAIFGVVIVTHFAIREVEDAVTAFRQRAIVVARGRVHAEVVALLAGSLVGHAVAAAGKRAVRVARAARDAWSPWIELLAGRRVDDAVAALGDRAHGRAEVGAPAVV